MGFSDKLKQMGDKAKASAAEHRDQISTAVENAAVVADRRTKGRYTDKIQRATQKTESMVERLGSDAEGQDTEAGSTPGTTAAEEPPPAA